MSCVQRNPVPAMLGLADELRQRQFRPQPPLHFSLQRADGTPREIVSYCIRDRVVQRAALQVIQPLAERLFLPSSFGFRPHRSVLGAVAAAREWLRTGHVHVVDADVLRAFDSLSHAIIMRRLRGLVPDPEVLALVQACLSLDDDPKSTRVGVPQGAVLSPLLCNLYLHPLDQCMHGSCVPMVRYADDFVLLALTRQAARQAMDRAASWLQRNALDLHPVKTLLRDASEPFTFLGQMLQAPRALALRTS